MSNPSVILTGFADEAANQKTAHQQFSAFAALGLQYYTIRFIDLGQGVKNVMQLTKPEIARLQRLHDEYGLRVSSLGSPIGKVKLLDVDDGTHNPFIPFRKYLDKQVRRAVGLASRVHGQRRGARPERGRAGRRARGWGRQGRTERGAR